jgi:hypothetical protein
MFEFEVTRSTGKYGDCPCSEAYEANGKWYVSFDDIKELLMFIQKYDDVIINKELNNIHILDEKD